MQLKLGTDTIILRSTCPSGGQDGSVTHLPLTVTAPVTPAMIHTNTNERLVTPAPHAPPLPPSPTATSQSRAHLMADLVAVQVKLMPCDETLSDIRLRSINIVTLCIKHVCVCVCSC